METQKKVILFMGVIMVALVIGIGFERMTGNVVKESGNNDNRILLQTEMGNIIIELYDDTPVADNLKRLVEEGAYDGVVMRKVGETRIQVGNDFINSADNSILNRDNYVFGKVVVGEDVVDEAIKRGSARVLNAEVAFAQVIKLE